MTRRLAQALVRRYPAAWRERYEREISALIDDTSIRFRDLAELLRGLLAERARELVSSDDHPTRTGAMVGLLKLAFVLSFIGCAVGVGLGVRQITGPWSESARGIGQIVFVVWFVIYLVVLFRARRKPLFSAEPPYDPATGIMLLAGLFAGLGFAVAGELVMRDGSSRHGAFAWYTVYSPWVNLFIYTNFLTDLCASLWPSRKLLQAFHELQVFEGRLKSNQKWVDGCHEMIAKGVPSPLREAEAQVDHWTRERDAARERAHALRYRARFRQDLNPRTFGLT